MNQDFVSSLAGWTNVYLLVGGMAATLTGLLFVAVSINITEVMSDSRPDLRRNAVRTFNQFLILIEISIVMLIPHQAALTLGLSIAALGLLSVAITAWNTRGLMPAAGTRSRFSLVASNLLFLGFIGCGVLVVIGGSGPLFLMLSLVIATLISSVFDAWALLVEVGHDMAQHGEPGSA